MSLANYRTLLRSYGRYLAFGGWHSFYSGVGQTYLIALFLPALCLHYNATTAEMALFYSVATLASAFALPVVGGWIDKVNLRLYSALNGVAAALACFITAFAPSMPVAFLGINWEPMAMLGLFLLRLTGQGLMGHICSTSVGRYFGRNRGKAMSISDQGHSMGEFVLPVLMVWLITTLGWQHTFAVMGLSCLLLFIPVSLALVRRGDDFQHPGRTAEPENHHADEEHWTRHQLLRSPYFYLVLPLACMGAFALTGLFFLQTVISVAKGWPEFWLATCFAVFPVCVLVSGLLVGPFIDTIGARRIFPFQGLPLALGVAVLAVADTPWLAPLYLALSGVSVGVSKTVTSAMWAEIYGTRHLGAIRSTAVTVMIFATAVSPVLFGVLLELQMPVNLLLWGLAAFIASTTVPALLAPLPRRRRGGAS
jgi:MFS family permease